MFGIRPFVPYTVLFATSTAAGYSAGYLNDTSQSSEWRSTGTTQQDIRLDMGAPLADNSVLYIFGANFRDATLHGDNDPIFGSIDITQFLFIYKDTRTKIRKGWWRLSGFTQRYLRLRITVQTPDPLVNPGAGPQYAIGALYVVPAANVIVPGARHQLPYNPDVFRPGVSTDFAGGSTARTNFGRRRVRLEVPTQGFHIDDEEKLYQISDMDEDQSFLFFENLRTPTVEARALDTSRVYLVKRRGDFSVTLAGDLLETGFSLEEQ
jgi:hypothetical protein